MAQLVAGNDHDCRRGRDLRDRRESGLICERIQLFLVVIARYFLNLSISRSLLVISVHYSSFQLVTARYMFYKHPF